MRTLPKNKKNKNKNKKKKEEEKEEASYSEKHKRSQLFDRIDRQMIFYLHWIVNWEFPQAKQ